MGKGLRAHSLRWASDQGNWAQGLLPALWTHLLASEVGHAPPALPGEERRGPRLWKPYEVPCRWGERRHRHRGCCASRPGLDSKNRPTRPRSAAPRPQPFQPALRCLALSQSSLRGCPSSRSRLCDEQGCECGQVCERAESVSMCVVVRFPSHV